MNAAHAFLDLLAAAGVRYLFGNPGTMELPLSDALAGDDRFQYLLGLQEVPVMAMADGYAMASGKLGVVNLHICCGLGNAMGMLYNAYREGTPLLVTAGQQDRRLKFEEPILAGDLVGVARPWTKWACQIERIEDLPNAVRRAVQTALTPPRGPVFLALPMDLMMEPCPPLDLSPPRVPDRRIRPPVEALRQAAEALRGAANPAILAGSRVTEADAMAELVALAERLGAPVYSESGTTHGRIAFPAEHPLNGQGLPLWQPEIRARLEGYDLLLVTGMNLLQQYLFFEPARPLPEGVTIIHLDEDPWQLGKNYPTAVPLWGDTKAGLAELDALLACSMTEPQRAAAAERAARHAAAHAAERERLRAEIAAQADHRPMTPPTLMQALARVLPPDVAVVEEAVTTTNTTFERLGALKNTTGYFGHRGWALGWGMGVAVGARLAWPDRPVLGVIGEGSAMYGFQALWTAARYRLPVTFVVPNNAQYQILKVCARKVRLPNAMQDRYEGLDVDGPEVDLVRLARAMGAAACRVTEPDALSDCVRDALKQRQLLLIDAPIARETPGRLSYG